jgi:hypothetical protein
MSSCRPLRPEPTCSCQIPSVYDPIPPPPPEQLPMVPDMPSATEHGLLKPPWPWAVRSTRSPNSAIRGASYARRVLCGVSIHAINAAAIRSRATADPKLDQRLGSLEHSSKRRRRRPVRSRPRYPRPRTSGMKRTRCELRAATRRRRAAIASSRTSDPMLAQDVRGGERNDDRLFAVDSPGATYARSPGSTRDETMPMHKAFTSASCWAPAEEGVDRCNHRGEPTAVVQRKLCRMSGLRSPYAAMQACRTGNKLALRRGQ